MATNARSKKTSKKTSKRTARKPAAKSSRTQLPEGYEAITAFADSWPSEDTKVGDMIEGTITDFDERDIKRGNKTETVQLLHLDTADGALTIWQSAGLKPLWDYEEGTEVAIIYEGLGKKKKGQNAPRLYKIGVR